MEPRRINPVERERIAEIERNETWLLGERLGHRVDPKSPEVRSRVADIVLQCREGWRNELEEKLDDRKQGAPADRFAKWCAWWRKLFR